MAIGQGELLLTPIQMANMTSIIANRGYYYTPHIIKEIANHDIDTNFTTKKYCSINKEYFNRLVISQDTGSAIKGIIRGDYFWGTGKEASVNAGHMNNLGKYYAFLAREQFLQRRFAQIFPVARE